MNLYIAYLILLQGDPIADAYRSVAFDHGSIVCVSDGCGWGEPSREAALRFRDNFVSYMALVMPDVLSLFLWI